jgi:GDP-4-dehydro-6-deoxy-D-mannose reductase
VTDIQRALVTGARGFVGSHLVRHLKQECQDIVLGVGRELLDPRNDHQFPYERLDLLDKEARRSIIKDFDPHVIYHLAGIAFVPHAEKDFSTTLKVNVGIVYELLADLIAINSKAVLILASSGEVYGKVDTTSLPIHETLPRNPANAYSLSKCYAEDAITYFHSKLLSKPIVARPFNHIGPGQSSEFVVSSFAKQLADIKLGNSNPEILVGNLEASRDFTDVRDVVIGYKLLAQAKGSCYNICSGTPIKIKNILSKLIEISGCDVKVSIDPSRYRVSENPLVYGSNKKISEEFAWQTKISLEKSLEDSFNYWYDLLRHSQ